MYNQASETHNIYRIWQDNSTIIYEVIPVSYEVNALEINKDDDLIYGTCVLDGQNGKVVKIDQKNLMLLNITQLKRMTPLT